MTTPTAVQAEHAPTLSPLAGVTFHGLQDLDTLFKLLQDCDGAANALRTHLENYTADGRTLDVYAPTDRDILTFLNDKSSGLLLDQLIHFAPRSGETPERPMAGGIWLKRSRGVTSVSSHT